MERIRYNSAIIIHSILFCLSNSHENPQIRQLFNLTKSHFLDDQVQGIKSISKYLGNEVNPKFKSILCDILYHVAKKDEKTKKKFLREGGTQNLMRLIETETYPTLIDIALKVFLGKTIFF